MQSANRQTILFSPGKQAQLMQADPHDPPERILNALALPLPKALLVLNGGTATLEEPLANQLKRTLQDGLARIVAEEQITVITGGTDAGIFQLFGQGLARWGRSAPCIGVAVETLVTWPGKPQGEAPLEPNHSHFVLTAGNRWGAETTTMYALIDALAHQCQSVALFAGGGQIAIEEMQQNVTQERTMIFLAGSGRATDAVLAAQAGQTQDDPCLNEIAQNGRILPFPLTEEPRALAALIRHTLALKSL